MAKKRKTKKRKTKKRKTPREYSEAAGHEVEKEMRRFKRGIAKSGRGRKAKSRKQAIAIALSEAREKGMKVPKRTAKKRK